MGILWTNKEGTSHPSLSPGKIPELGNAERSIEEHRGGDCGKPAFLIGKRGDLHGLKDKEGGEEGYGTSQDPQGSPWKTMEYSGRL